MNLTNFLYVRQSLSAIPTGFHKTSLKTLCIVFVACSLLLSATACGVKKDPIRPSDIKERDKKHKILN